MIMEEFFGHKGKKKKVDKAMTNKMVTMCNPKQNPWWILINGKYDSWLKKTSQRNVCYKFPGEQILFEN